ncbi:MAG: T9SS type A sorting domain-containing protein [Bacteroidota bacterium]
MEAKKGDRIQVDVTVTDFDSLIVLQFPMIWDPNVIDFVEIIDAELTSSLPTFSEADVDDGVLFFVWTDDSLIPESLDDSTAIFSVAFDVIGDPGVNTEIWTDDQVKDIEAGGLDGAFDTLYFQNGMVTVMNSTGTSTIDNLPLTTLHQNNPNPFRTQTRIPFDLRTAEDVNLRIYDSHGRTVFKQNNRLGEGSHYITIDRDNLGSAGIYWYELTAGDRSLTRKMVLLK